MLRPIPPPTGSRKISRVKPKTKSLKATTTESPSRTINSNDRLSAIADSRYYFRRAFRIIDDEARKAGLDPLECQALVQLIGAPGSTLSVTELALRLDVPRGLVSRIAKALEERRLASRIQSKKDGRVTLVTATQIGSNLVRRVDAACQPRFGELQREMSLPRRREALRIWAANFGIQ